MKKIITLSLIMMSIIIFNVSMRLVEGEIIRSFTSFGKGENSTSYVYIDEVIDSSKETFIDLSIKNKVNIQITKQEIIDNKEVITLYWQIFDKKYIEDLSILNKEITLEKFNQLNSQINNYDSSNEYFLKMPNENYYYNLLPFNQLDEVSNQLLLIFSESKENIDRFIKDLDANGFVAIEENIGIKKTPFYQIYLTSIYKSPGLMLATSIIFLLFFIMVYEDRRTMSIYLINGKSKYEYAKSFSFNILKQLLKIFSIVFFIMLFLNFTKYHGYILLLVKHYIFWSCFYVAALMLIPIIISYLFTEIDQTSYKLGRKENSFSIKIISAYKLVISIMLIINLGNIVTDLTERYETYKNIKLIQQDTVDMYQINHSNTSFEINNRNKIINNIKKLSKPIYVEYLINKNLSSNSNLNLNDKVVYANEDYLKLYKMTEADLLNDIFVSQKLFDKIKNDPNMLCKEYSICNVSSDKIKVVKRDLIIIMDFSGSNIGLIKDDYIIVKEEINNNTRLSNIFIHASEKESKEILSQLNNEFNTKFKLFNLHDNISNYFKFSKMIIQENIKWVSTYLMIYMVYTLLFYQVTFDRYRKENSILFISGKNPYLDLISNFTFQIIINALILLIFKKVKYPLKPIGIFIFIYFLTLIVEVVALIIALIKIRKNLVYNLKERI